MNTFDKIKNKFVYKDNGFGTEVITVLKAKYKYLGINYFIIRSIKIDQIRFVVAMYSLGSGLTDRTFEKKVRDLNIELNDFMELIEKVDAALNEQMNHLVGTVDDKEVLLREMATGVVQYQEGFDRVDFWKQFVDMR